MKLVVAVPKSKDSIAKKDKVAIFIKASLELAGAMEVAAKEVAFAVGRSIVEVAIEAVTLVTLE